MYKYFHDLQIFFTSTEEFNLFIFLDKNGHKERVFQSRPIACKCKEGVGSPKLQLLTPTRRTAYHSEQIWFEKRQFLSLLKVLTVGQKN